MRHFQNSIGPLSTILIWGILGSLALIFISGKSHIGLTVIPIYGISLILSIVTVKLQSPGKVFLDLFTTTLLTFTVMCLIEYIFMINVVNPGMLGETFFGHLWRVASILGIGTSVSLLLTFLATLRKQVK